MDSNFTVNFGLTADVPFVIESFLEKKKSLNGNTKINGLKTDSLVLCEWGLFR